MNTTMMHTAMNQCMNDAKPKTSKHLMERKRRARINDSLLQLKSLVFPTLRKEIARHPKLEKADILEMTVRHIQELQTSANTPTNVSQFHAGFSECLSEVSQFLSNCENIELDTRLRILNHLADKCSTMPEPTTATPEAPRRLPSASSPTPIQHHSPVHHHRRSPVQRHSPYGYHMESRRQSAAPAPHHNMEARVPPMNSAALDNLVVVIPSSPVEKYTPASHHQTVLIAASNKVSPKMDMYPTPPQSPTEDFATTYYHQTSTLQHHQIQHQTRVPSSLSHQVSRSPILVQEESVWRPW